MFEKDQIIGGVSVTSTELNCPGCGGTIGLSFDPATGTMTCPFCGLASPLPTITTGAFAEELDFNSAMQRASVNWGNIKKLVICSNCGDQSLYDAEQITGYCPFCGSTSVTSAAENPQIMAPNAVIPFSITRDQTQECFTNFLKKKRLVKKDTLKCKLENVTGIYLPFWTFDTFTVSSYEASIINVGEETRTVTGVINEYFNDAVVYASDKINNPYISKIQKFDFEWAVPYSPRYLAGIPAERYTIGLYEGWERIRNEQIPKKLKDILRKQHLRGPRNIKTTYYNVKFRCLLAPVYLASYRYGDKTLKVAINGQTGQTYCDAPTNIKRIFVLAIIVMTLISVIEVALYLLFVWLMSFRG